MYVCEKGLAFLISHLTRQRHFSGPLFIVRGHAMTWDMSPYPGAFEQLFLPRRWGICQGSARGGGMGTAGID